MGLPSRMKEYERTVDIHLIKKLPVIIRLDGKAFHTFCRGLKKPWDQRLNDIMVNTTITLCKEIQGAQIGYTQSDEITILITDFENLRTEAWFNYRLQKIISVSASIATEAFVKGVKSFLPDKYYQAMRFDSRANNMPNIAEVLNNFLWRQRDAIKNSKQSLGQSLYSHRELQEKNTDVIVEMASKDYNINWNDLPNPQKWGTMVVKRNKKLLTPEGSSYVRTCWEGDKETPGPEEIKKYILEYTNLEKANVY